MLLLPAIAAVSQVASWGEPLIAEKATTSPEGGFGGGQVGYNWQAGRWVFGLETDVQGAGVNRANSLTNGLPIAIDRGSNNLDWFGTVRGRFGFTIFDSALLYATGGFAYGGVEDKVYGAFIGGISQTVSNSQTETGYVAGASLEYALTPSWSFKIEYQYMNLGDTTVRGGTGGAFLNPFAPALPAACSEGAFCLSAVHELDSAHSYNTARGRPKLSLRSDLSAAQIRFSSAVGSPSGMGSMSCIIKIAKQAFAA